MKILAGAWRGRPIDQPATRTVRPLSEKVRAALFDVVGDPTGLTVLDAYAGSGAAGLEALSRGALLVEAIESNARVGRVIQTNAAKLEAGMQYILHQLTVESWLALPQQTPPEPRYNLIITDPPYAQLKVDVLDRLVAFLAPAGILAVSHSSRLGSPDLSLASLIKSKTYGDTSLSFYKKAQ
jgi:16S rRNA (guanine966-N2)-methyltransferase